MTNGNSHLKRWWNSFEPGDLVRVKRAFTYLDMNRFRVAETERRIFFPLDALFLCLEMTEDDGLWILIAPGGEPVLCHHNHLELVRFANEKDEEETDGKQCV